MAYKSFASGYLVIDGKVLLAHHNKFDKWVPPGGHIDEDETPADTVVREFKEETNLDVAIIPAAPPAFAGDSNATPIPLPFHMDLEREGFDVPHIGHFFYVRLLSPLADLSHQQKELFDVRWFSDSDLQALQTFDQVRALAAYALNHYPKVL